MQWEASIPPQLIKGGLLSFLFLCLQEFAQVIQATIHKYIRELQT